MTQIPQQTKVSHIIFIADSPLWSLRCCWFVFASITALFLGSCIAVSYMLCFLCSSNTISNTITSEPCLSLTLTIFLLLSISLSLTLGSITLSPKLICFRTDKSSLHLGQGREVLVFLSLLSALATIHSAVHSPSLSLPHSTYTHAFLPLTHSLSLSPIHACMHAITSSIHTFSTHLPAYACITI